ncbi:hypothetical protein [Streptacidiphilus monticola]|uniref:Uncharacterized protein n=1 Tax=Streptacidiphilus monticola TaxID=2161674 RepID=A0ABW1G381_9ACTN
MKHFIGPHRAATPAEFMELALGTPLDLWLGTEDESDDERAARLDAARDILADDPDLTDRLIAKAADAFRFHPADVLRIVAVAEPARPTPRRRAVPRRAA